MEKIQIALHGCDDSTHFEMDLTDEEIQVVKKISEKSIATSSYGCQPILVIKSKEE